MRQSTIYLCFLLRQWISATKHSFAISLSEGGRSLFLLNPVFKAYIQFHIKATFQNQLE